MDEYHLAGLQLRAAVESEPAGLVVDEECGALHERHDVGDFHNRVRVRVGDLRVATVVKPLLRDGSEDAISRLESAVRRRRLDFARHLGSRDEWQVRLHLISAGNLKQVEEVDGRRSDSDPDELIA